MITAHHLADSRSHRIVWLMEELELPYALVFYAREPDGAAPAAMKAIHEIGASPIITDGDLTLAESGAIVDYIVRRYGAGRLTPPEGSDAFEICKAWVHYTEGSAVHQIQFNRSVAALGEAAAPLKARAAHQLDRHLGYLERSLAGRTWLVGEDMTIADLMMSVVAELANRSDLLGPYPNVLAWMARFQARPAYRRAMEKGGGYSLGPPLSPAA